MREIKFRAWNKEEKYMQEPHTLQEYLNDLFLRGFEATKEKHKKADQEYKHIVFMQFTGLTDKNGKEIYEGDIVKTFSEEGDDIGVVVFRSGKDYQHKLYSAFGLYHKGNWFTWTECVEVIGNVHENPELLEGYDGSDR